MCRRSVWSPELDWKKIDLDLRGKGKRKHNGKAHTFISSPKFFHSTARILCYTLLLFEGLFSWSSKCQSSRQGGELLSEFSQHVDWVVSRPATILCVGLKKEKREGKPAAFSHAQLKNWERIYVLVSPRTGSQIRTTSYRWRLNFPLKSKKGREGEGRGEDSFASNLKLNFGVLIRSYWPGQVHSLIKNNQIDFE